MTSKKYIIQSLPPTRTRGHPSKLSARTELPKKRDKQTIQSPSLPCAPYAPYELTDFEYKYRESKPAETPRDQPPPSLETDLKRYTDYKNNEVRFARSGSNVFMHPFKYIDNSDDPDAQEKASDSANDFSTWAKDMNTKLMSKKRQVKYDKKRAERAERHARKEAERAAALAAANANSLSHSSSFSSISSTSTSSSSSSSSRSTSSAQQIRTLFHLGKKKTTKEDEYNALDQHVPRVMTVQNLKVSTTREKPSKSESHSHFQQSNNDDRLFHVVRPPPMDEEDLDTPSPPSNPSTPTSTNNGNIASISANNLPVLSTNATVKSKSFPARDQSPPRERDRRALPYSHSAADPSPFSQSTSNNNDKYYTPTHAHVHTSFSHGYVPSTTSSQKRRPRNVVAVVASS